MNWTNRKCALRRALLAAVIALGVCGAVLACERMPRLVLLDVNEYIPALHGDFGRYRRQSLHLAGIVLQTGDFPRSYYYDGGPFFVFEPVKAKYARWGSCPLRAKKATPSKSSDANQQARDEGDRYLREYLWDCVAKALRAVGMKVYAEPPASYNGPTLRVFVHALDERHFYARAKLTGPNTTYEQVFNIEESLPPLDTRTPETEAKRSRTLINRFVEEMLSDPDFARAFLERQ